MSTNILFMKPNNLTFLQNSYYDIMNKYYDIDEDVNHIPMKSINIKTFIILHMYRFMNMNVNKKISRIYRSNGIIFCSTFHFILF